MKNTDKLWHRNTQELQKNQVSLWEQNNIVLNTEAPVSFIIRPVFQKQHQTFQMYFIINDHLQILFLILNRFI